MKLAFFLRALHLISVKSLIVRGSEQCESKVALKAVLLPCPVKDMGCEDDDPLTLAMAAQDAQRYSGNFKTFRLLKNEKEKAFPNRVKDCKRKLLITLKLKNSGLIPCDDEYLVIDHVYDPITGGKGRLLSPVVLKLHQEQTIQLYGLEFQRVVNADPFEEESDNSEGSTGQENPCGVVTYDGKPIPFSEGFSCNCESNGNGNHKTSAEKREDSFQFRDSQLIAQKKKPYTDELLGSIVHSESIPLVQDSTSSPDGNDTSEQDDDDVCPIRGVSADRIPNYLLEKDRKIICGKGNFFDELCKMLKEKDRSFDMKHLNENYSRNKVDIKEKQENIDENKHFNKLKASRVSSAGLVSERHARLNENEKNKFLFRKNSTKALNLGKVYRDDGHNFNKSGEIIRGKRENRRQYTDSLIRLEQKLTLEDKLKKFVESKKVMGNRRKRLLEISHGKLKNSAGVTCRNAKDCLQDDSSLYNDGYVQPPPPKYFFSHDKFIIDPNEGVQLFVNSTNGDDYKETLSNDEYYRRFSEKKKLKKNYENTAPLYSQNWTRDRNENLNGYRNRVGQMNEKDINKGQSLFDKELGQQYFYKQDTLKMKNKMKERKEEKDEEQRGIIKEGNARESNTVSEKNYKSPIQQKNHLKYKNMKNVAWQNEERELKNAKSLSVGKSREKCKLLPQVRNWNGGKFEGYTQKNKVKTEDDSHEAEISKEKGGISKKPRFRVDKYDFGIPKNEHGIHNLKSNQHSNRDYTLEPELNEKNKAFNEKKFRKNNILPEQGESRNIDFRFEIIRNQFPEKKNPNQAFLNMKNYFNVETLRTDNKKNTLGKYETRINDRTAAASDRYGLPATEQVNPRNYLTKKNFFGNLESQKNVEGNVNLNWNTGKLHKFNSRLQKNQETNHYDKGLARYYSHWPSYNKLLENQNFEYIPTTLNKEMNNYNPLSEFSFSKTYKTSVPSRKTYLTYENGITNEMKTKKVKKRRIKRVVIDKNSEKFTRSSESTSALSENIFDKLKEKKKKMENSRERKIRELSNEKNWSNSDKKLESNNTNIHDVNTFVPEPCKKTRVNYSTIQKNWIEVEKSHIAKDVERLLRSYVNSPKYVIDNIKYGSEGKRDTEQHTEENKECNSDGAEPKNKDTTHCMRLGDLWYSLYKIQKPSVAQIVGIQLFDKHTLLDGTTQWRDISKGKMIRIGTFLPKAEDDLPTISLSFFGEKPEDPVFSIDPDNYYLLIPSQISDPSKLSYYPQADGGPAEYMLVNSKDVSSGAECNMIGTSFEAFAQQPNRCSQPKGSCLKRQITDLWREDMEARIRGKRGKYFLENFGTIPKSPVKTYTNYSGEFLALDYYGEYTSTIEIEVKADFNAIVKKESIAQIPVVYVDGTYPKKTRIVLSMINIGLTSSYFRPRLGDCSPDLDPAWCPLEGPLVTVPPQQRHDFKLDLSGALPSKRIKVTVQILNEYNKKVAYRKVLIQKDDRCICAFHCKCNCMTNKNSRKCRKLSEEEFRAAGYFGSFPYRGNSATSPSASIGRNIKFILLVAAYVLLIMGFFKGILGLCCRNIGIAGTKIIVGPRQICKYYETELQCCTVLFDECGFPVHPTTCLPVQIVPMWVEVILNFFFFFLYPLRGFGFVIATLPFCSALCEYCEKLCQQDDENDYDQKSSCPLLSNHYNSTFFNYNVTTLKTIQGKEEECIAYLHYKGDDDPLEEDDTEFVLQEMKRYRKK